MPNAGWPRVILADVVDLRLSSVDKKITPGEKKVRLCNYSDVYNHSVLCSDMEYMEGTATEREVRNCKLEVGDVIITKDSETADDIGVSAVVREQVADLICGYHLAILRPQKSALDGEYLHYALRTSNAKRQFRMYANGITRFGLRAGDIERVGIPFPPLSEQRKIAAILSSVDDAIEKTQAVIDQVQVVKRGLMQELLTRGLPARHTRFKQTEIGEIPEDWDSMSLEDYCAQVTDGTHGTPKRVEHGVPLLTSKNLRNGKLDLESCYLISEDDFAEISKRSGVDPGDVIFGMIGTIGNPLVVPGNFQKFAIKNVALFKLYGDLTKAGWLVAYLESPMFARRVLQQQTGNAQKFLSLGFLRRLRIPNASADEREEIVGTLSVIDHRLRGEEGCHASLMRIKSALMSVLLTGELRVTPDLEPA